MKIVDPTDELLLDRLQAFSDVVIGFSIALLGLSLHVPASLAAIGSHAPELGVFLVGFALIALVWWFHNRLFAHYFVANSLSIVLNFAMLAAVVVLVYVIEAFTTLFNAPSFEYAGYITGVSLWAYSYGVVMTLMGLMFAIGVRERRAQLDAGRYIWGIERAINSGAGGIAILIMGAALPHLPPKFAGFIGLVAFIPLIAQKFVARRLKTGCAE